MSAQTSQQESTTDAPLVPNKAHIAEHLYALFSPSFVLAYPDAWIEIPYGKLNMAKNFGSFELQKPQTLRSR
jgi:hypothetical protein